MEYLTKSQIEHAVSLYKIALNCEWKYVHDISDQGLPSFDFKLSSQQQLFLDNNFRLRLAAVRAEIYGIIATLARESVMECDSKSALHAC